MAAEDYEAFDSDAPLPPNTNKYAVTSSAPPDEAGLLRWELDTADIVVFLEHSLRGDVWNEQVGAWEEGHGLRLLNDDGIKYIITIVLFHVNKATFLSNITDADVEKICSHLHIALSKALFINYENFEIKPEHLEMLTLNIMNFIYISLKKAIGGMMLKQLSQATQVIERVGQPADKGILSKIPFVR